ncbi:hypothetical protein QUB63_01010 [Microcoleus sp. ARI1-B5]|uniref:hypothetical protein n=1 Tax=unclassified Microcoleus TaxID=2642155 RepID=UPI002FD2CFBA
MLNANAGAIAIPRAHLTCVSSTDRLRRVGLTPVEPKMRARSAIDSIRVRLAVVLSLVYRRISGRCEDIVALQSE